MPRNERILFFRNTWNLKPGSSLNGSRSHYRQLLQVFTLVVFGQQLEVLTRVILGEDERKVLLPLIGVVKDCL